MGASFGPGYPCFAPNQSSLSRPFGGYPLRGSAISDTAAHMAASKPRMRAWAMGKRYRGWIARAQEGLCAHCGQPLNLAKNTKPTHADAPTIDHVHPRCGGGSRDLGNVIVMHRKCNNRKGGRTPNGCELVWHATVAAKLESEFGSISEQTLTPRVGSSIGRAAAF